MMREQLRERERSVDFRTDLQATMLRDSVAAYRQGSALDNICGRCFPECRLLESYLALGLTLSSAKGFSVWQDLKGQRDKEGANRCTCTELYKL